MKNFILFFLFLINSICSIAQWSKLHSPEDCRALGIARTSNGIYLGTNGGLYKSTDEAQSWNQLNVLQNEHISSIASIADTLIVLYHHTVDIISPHNEFTLVSFDGGNSWFDGDTAEAKYHVRSYSHNNSILIVTQYKLYHSSNYGINWDQINFSVGSLYRVYVFNSYFIVSTIDSLGTIYNFSSPIDSIVFTSFTPPGNFQVTMLDSLMYSFEDLGTGQFNLLSSSDFGQSWGSLITIDSTIYSTIYAHDDSLFYIDSNSEYFTSADLGMTWNLTHRPFNLSNLPTLQLNNGEFLTINFMNAPQVYNMALDSTYQIINELEEPMAILYATDSLLYAVSNGKLFRSDDHGMTWDYRSNPLFPIRQVYQDTIFASGQFVSRSYDGGLSWQNVITNSSINDICRTGNKLYAAGYFDYYSSIDWGDTWQLLPSIPTTVSPCGTTDNSLSSIAVFNNRLFTTSVLGIVYQLDSSDSSWNYAFCAPSPAAAPFQFYYLKALQTKLVLYGRYSMFVTDDGINWIMAGMNGLPTDSYGDVIVPLSLVQIGTDIIGYCDSYGVYVTSDNGNNWSPIFSGISPFYPISLVEHNNLVYAGSDYQGIWVANTILNSPSITLNNNSSLDIYPNPSNGQFQIKYKHEFAGPISFKLYNSIGTLVKEVELNKDYTIVSTEGLQQGIYIGKTYSKTSDCNSVVRIIILPNQ